ncbi:MAG: VTT domain-containing protein [Candidatus Thorarchaeota archaeon]|jgi:membrane protein YqaA with SNARE-associated domain
MQGIFEFITTMISQGYLGLFIICFAINMIPFLSPSNMVLAGAAVLTFSILGPVGFTEAVLIGIIVAITATLAKLIHFYVVRGSRVILSEERLKSLDSEKHRVEKWGALALFIAAASPVPDDPLIVYVGLTKYSTVKFLLSYFTGKVAVTIAGAIIALFGLALGGNFFESMPIVVASIVLTAIITGILFKRKTEGQESDMLQDILEDELIDDDDGESVDMSKGSNSSTTDS